jgi:hypothetical protein
MPVVLLLLIRAYGLFIVSRSGTSSFSASYDSGVISRDSTWPPNACSSAAVKSRHDSPFDAAHLDAHLPVFLDENIDLLQLHFACPLE